MMKNLLNFVKENSFFVGLVIASGPIILGVIPLAKLAHGDISKVNILIDIVSIHVIWLKTFIVLYPLLITLTLAFLVNYLLSKIKTCAARKRWRALLESLGVILLIVALVVVLAIFANNDSIHFWMPFILITFTVIWNILFLSIDEDNLKTADPHHRISLSCFAIAFVFLIVYSASDYSGYFFEAHKAPVKGSNFQKYQCEVVYVLKEYETSSKVIVESDARILHITNDDYNLSEDVCS